MAVWHEESGSLGDRPDYAEWVTDVTDTLTSRTPIYDGLPPDDGPDLLDGFLDGAARVALIILLACIAVGVAVAAARGLGALA